MSFMDVPKANVVLINTRRVFSRGRHVFVVAALTLVATLVDVVVAAGKIDSIASRSTGTFSTGTFSTDTFSINATTADDVPRPAPPSVIARLRVFAQYAAVASYCAAGEDPRPRACVVDWERCVDRLAAVDGLDLIAAAAAAVDVKPRPFLVQRVGATEDVDMVSMFLHSRPESSSSSSSSFSSAPVMAPVLTHGTRVLATFSSYSSDEWAGGEGYIAVNEGRRELIIGLAGSTTAMDWINDFRFWQVDYQHPRVLPSSRPRIHSGIYAVYRTVRARFEKAFERVLREGDAQLLIEHEVAVVGHSLGAALASLLTMELRAHQLASVEASPDMTPIPTTMPTLPRFPSAMRLALYSFAQPALGNRALVDFFDTTMLGETAAGIAVPPLSLPRVHRVVGKHDIVPLLPPVQLGYAHFTSGQLFWVDWVGDGRDRPARTFQCMSNVGDAAETAGIVDSAAVHNRLFHTIQDAQDHVRASLLASDSAIASEAMAADACRFHGFTRYGHVSYYWNFDSVRDRCRMLVR